MYSVVKNVTPKFSQSSEEALASHARHKVVKRQLRNDSVEPRCLNCVYACLRVRSCGRFGSLGVGETCVDRNVLFDVHRVSGDFASFSALLCVKVDEGETGRVGGECGTTEERV